MLKKIIIGALLVTVIGAGGTALAYNVATQETEIEPATPEPLANEWGYGAEQSGQQAALNEAGDPNMVAEGFVGEPWQESGTIAEIDDFGFQFALQNGESVYIELGPADFWQNQGVELLVGQPAIVNGTNNEGLIHATQVMLADGQTLQIRSETGQPLWNGGVTNGQGQNAGQANGDQIPEPQAQVDEWITLKGTLMSFQGGSMTMATSEGEIIAFQTGQPRFFADQGVTFNVGDEIIVVGFYQGEQFKAGDITQVASGLRVMLLDPNGRPLWAGPGGNGGSNGNGNGNGKGKGGNQGGNGSAGGNH